MLYEVITDIAVACALADRVLDHLPRTFDILALLDLGPLHRQRDRADPVGQAGHRLRRRRRGAGLDPLLPLRRDGRDELV